MGYCLSIGEYAKEWDDGELHVIVKPVTDPMSPAYSEPTDYTNERWPSYTSWWEFAKFVGLTDVLFDPETNWNIRAGHPGWFVITKKFKQDIDDAYTHYMKKYPDAVPSFGIKIAPSRKQDIELCRLTWLKYWVDWALANCENPIFQNT